MCQGFCKCSLIISHYSMKACELCAGFKREKGEEEKKETPSFALFCFDKQAYFCPGSSIFLTLQWRHKYRMNAPFCCATRSCVSRSVNRIRWDLFVSSFCGLTSLSPFPSNCCFFIVTCTINYLQFG